MFVDGPRIRPIRDLPVLELMPSDVVIQCCPQGISPADPDGQGFVDPLGVSLYVGDLVDDPWWVFDQDHVLVPSQDAGVDLPLVFGELDVGPAVGWVATYVFIPAGGGRFVGWHLRGCGGGRGRAVDRCPCRAVVGGLVR